MSEGLQSPLFVGRREEMATLAALLDRAGTGEPGFAIVAGEAGVGKTRLVSELAARAGQAGFTVLTGHCVELGAEGLPLAPLIDALRALARTLAPGELADVLGPARRGLGRLLPELRSGRRDRARRAGDPAGPAARAGPRPARPAAARRPLLLVLEDLHWADQSTLDLVAFLIRSLREVRRPAPRHLPVRRAAPPPSAAAADRPAGSGCASVDRIELRRFDRDEVAAQLTAILAAEPGQPGRT